MNVLEVNHLSKHFSNDGVETEVLRDISLTVKKGEFVSVMGQSGSGKSTLLYNISGMDIPSSGQVILDEQVMTDQTTEQLASIRLHKIGFIFQNNYLLKNLTIFDNICLPALQANKKDRKVIEQEASQWMDKLNINGIKQMPINKVSGGQLQRSAICRALINEPSILFADEPTGALNSKISEEVISIFNDLNQEGMTILTVTHDPKVAAASERIIYLKDGQIEEELSLGKRQDDQDIASRQSKTMAWLMERNF